MTAKKWPEIDGVRALCAIAVMLSHWGPGWAAVPLDIGGVGVGVFYAISGFLITNILLSARDQYVPGGRFWDAMKIFYARRALRIFPVYYGLLGALAVLAALGEVKIGGLPWHFAYLTNVYVFVHRHWPSPVVTPFWSLAVEEQFYLLWPAVVLLTPKAALRSVILGAIAFGVGFRLALTLAGFDPGTQTGVLLPACFDSLGMGALLAILARDHAFEARSMAWMTAAGIASYAALVFCWSTSDRRLPSVLAHLSVGLFAFGLLAMIISRKASAALAWLNWKPLQYLGALSYGLYLFHQSVAYGVDHLAQHFLHEPLPIWPRFAVCFGMDVAVASASWFLFEKPILGLKARFDYRRTPPHLEPSTVMRAA